VLHNICLLRNDELQLQDEIIIVDVEEAEPLQRGLNIIIEILQNLKEIQYVQIYV